jgi:hypothetical protein
VPPGSRANSANLSACGFTESGRYFLRNTDRIDIAVGADARQGITLARDPVDDTGHVQYLDAGARLGFNYHPSKHFMISGVLLPFWAVVREAAAAAFSRAVPCPALRAAAAPALRTIAGCGLTGPGLYYFAPK